MICKRGGLTGTEVAQKGGIWSLFIYYLHFNGGGVFWQKKGVFGAGTTRKGGSYVRTQLEKGVLGAGQVKRGGGYRDTHL